jgi:hypothetical protein
MEGQLLDASTEEALPFAKIYNKTTKTGTITDNDGYFKIGVQNSEDEILISQVGYKSQNMLYDLSSDFQKIYLDARLQLIQEMIATPRDISYLCELIQKCRSNTNKVKNNGKAYYGLKTYIDSSQIELIEGFYNYTSTGYDMEKIELKAGRLAIRPDEGRMFMSMESSKAITQLSLFNDNPYFPDSPFDMKARHMQKKFFMTLKYKYLLDNNDSVYVIEYLPKDTIGTAFEGTIWINKTKFQVLKVTTNCTDCANYPFLPIFPVDEIRSLNMSITKTFTETNGKMCFNHIDFQYDIDYKSRIRDTNFIYTNLTNEILPDSLFQFFSVRTNAVLYSYDQKNQFQLPKFHFLPGTSDYRKISGLPYNSFFWKYNNEDRVNNEKEKNQLFFTDSSSIDNKALFNSYFYGSQDQGFIFTYKTWSKNRIRFRNTHEIQKDNPKNPVTISEKYNLSIQLFADVNTYMGESNVITAAIFDPYESYYNLPMDMATHCFINLYFDLHEIARRDLQRELEKNPANFENIYLEFMTNFEKSKSLFLYQTERGTNEKYMRIWNDFIREKLRIDNVDLFNPFQKE